MAGLFGKVLFCLRDETCGVLLPQSLELTSDDFQLWE